MFMWPEVLISILIGILVFSWFISAFIWALTAVFVKNPSFTRIYVLTSLVVFVAMGMLISASGRGGSPSAEASIIVSNLRSLQSASLMFRADKRDFIHEMPRGVNNIEYLTQHTANPDWSGWDNYIFIIGGDHWWIGLDLEQASVNVRRRLVARASSMGLFGTSQPEPPISNDEAYFYRESDKFVWLHLKEDTTASDIISNLRTMKAAVLLFHADTENFATKTSMDIRPVH